MRNWTGNLLFTPLAANFGDWPGGVPQGAAAGRTAGRRFFFPLLSPPALRGWPRGVVGGVCSWTGSLLSTPLADFGPAPEVLRRDAQVDGEFAFHASRLQLRAGPEGATKGCAALARSLSFYLSLTGLSRGGQAMLVTGPNTISDCRPDPQPLMGWGRQALYCVSWTCLVAPVGLAGWKNKISKI